MLDKIKKTGKNTFVYSIGNIALKASGIILIPIYSKHLSIEEFGILALFEVIYRLLLIVTGLGTKYALTRWYWLKELERKKKSVVFSAWLLNILLTTVSLFASCFILIWYAKPIFDAEVSNRLIVIFISSCFLRIFVEFPLLLQRIQHKAITQTLYQLFILVITITLTVYYISYKNYSLDGVFFALLISNLLGSIVLLPYMYRNLEFKFERAILNEMLKYGFPIFISNLVTLTFVFSDRFILNIFGTHSNVGQYSLAYKISNLIQMVFVASFMNAYTHIFFQGAEEQKYDRFFSKSLTYFVLVILYASLGIIFFSKEMAVILSRGESDYWMSYTIVPLLVLGTVFTGIQGMLVLPLASKKKTKTISFVSISAAVLNFILNLLFIPKFNSQGAALSTAIAQILSVLWLYFEVVRRDLVKYETLKIFKCLIIAVLYIAIYYLTSNFDFYIRFILRTCLLIAYPFILYFLGFYEQIELLRLKQAWKKWSKLSRLKENLKQNL
jgi:O-antigen/teichoic acid export membrane protein